ncbi:protein of unknown function [Candidatus Methylocalor cossyra]|uniref:Uncharacterized protein n=1 Tax=Candidatus Methylocalor cossyra TaxID=3108543 RepID=A0ABP1C5G5_9GAMM
MPRITRPSGGRAGRGLQRPFASGPVFRRVEPSLSFTLRPESVYFVLFLKNLHFASGSRGFAATRALANSSAAIKA